MADTKTAVTVAATTAAAGGASWAEILSPWLAVIATGAGISLSVVTLVVVVLRWRLERRKLLREIEHLERERE